MKDAFFDEWIQMLVVLLAVFWVSLGLLNIAIEQKLPEGVFAYLGAVTAGMLGAWALVIGGIHAAKQAALRDDRLQSKRLDGLREALSAEIQQVAGLCGPTLDILKKYRIHVRQFQRGLAESPKPTLAMTGRAVFPTLVTVERHIDEIGLMPPHISKLTFNLFHLLQAARIQYSQGISTGLEPELLGALAEDWSSIAIEETEKLVVALGDGFQRPPLHLTPEEAQILREEPDLFQVPLDQL